MDRQVAIDQLPEPYAVAIRLADAGEPPAAIAEAAGVEEEAVAPLLDVATAKLATVMAHHHNDESGLTSTRRLPR